MSNLFTIDLDANALGVRDKAGLVVNTREILGAQNTCLAQDTMFP